MGRPWVIAHRGASGHAPENTMASFRRAVELGATFIETDLRLSRDARFVAIHDSTLDRTTNGRGLVHDFTLEQLRELDAGSWFGAKFAGERVPTIEEIFAFARESDVVFYLEIKHEGTWGIHHAMASALRAAEGAAARCVVISFDARTLEHLRRLDATLMMGLLFESPTADALAKAQKIGARQILPRADLVTCEMVTQAHRADMQLATWTVNEQEQMRSLISMGVNGIMTNYPDRLCKVIKESSVKK
ncbi:MAG TPA: glycerophosphodiester phosphodiesterase family protein [Candidatus Acidoferrales bacterium]|nr:glycerophosphodiester phosphodiesterase family protein [Candidatus Acidoferrales bacterium]